MAERKPYLARDAHSTPEAAVCRWCSTVKVRAKHGPGGLGTDPGVDTGPLICTAGCDGPVKSRG